MNRNVDYEPEARNMLASLWQAQRRGEISRGEYQEFIDYLENLGKSLKSEPIAAIGQPCNYLLGLVTNENVRRITDLVAMRFVIEVRLVFQPELNQVKIAALSIFPPLRG